MAYVYAKLHSMCYYFLAQFIISDQFQVLQSYTLLL